ncbi:Germin-like protein subfamily T member 2 [Morella rubra]|uniref:Germin-like protein n=1 Tax=Morella rubra TaxID=262757 RepID=A0A6A1VU34_9ROSI|nr:Germin-like protein subfamily T member 2 [Morella rubra]
MVTLSASPFRLLSYLVVLLLLPLLSFASNPDPLQDFYVANMNAPPLLNGFPCKPTSKVTSDDFFFDGFMKEGNTANTFGVNLTTGDVLSFIGLNTLGISMNRVDFTRGGINPPHFHPRASETGVVMKGKPLVGFVTIGNMFYSKVLTAGQMFVIPQRLVHFRKNVGDGKALAFTTFNSHMPGAIVLLFALFASTPPIPNDVLTQHSK